MQGIAKAWDESIAVRYQALYTGAIADMLDRAGYRDQVLPPEIAPFTRARRLAGPAFTGQGYPCADVTHNDSAARVAMIGAIPPGAVSLWACGGSRECAHWGELMSMASRQRGATGAVIDGGVRDLEMIDAMDFPVFARFACAASSIGRWDIQEWQVEIRIGATRIFPGDFVFGDRDGVVIVPRELTVDVLEAAEDVFRREGAMREELRSGIPLSDAFARHGSL